MRVLVMLMEKNWKHASDLKSTSPERLMFEMHAFVIIKRRPS